MVSIFAFLGILNPNCFEKYSIAIAKSAASVLMSALNVI